MDPTSAMQSLMADYKTLISDHILRLSIECEVACEQKTDTGLFCQAWRLNNGFTHANGHVEQKGID